MYLINENYRIIKNKVKQNGQEKIIKQGKNEMR